MPTCCARRSTGRAVNSDRDASSDIDPAVAPIGGLVVDAGDPGVLARFWQGIIGGRLDDTDPDWVTLTGVGAFGYVGFQRVDEPKATKNRVHLDLDVDDLVGATTAAVALGATAVGEVMQEPTNSFQVMCDPEGNEFCLVVTD